MADKSGKKRFKWSGLFGFGGPEGPQLGSGGLESSLPTHHEVSHTRSTSGSAVGGGSGGGVAGFFGSLGSASGLSAIPGSSPAREPPSQGNANGSPRLHLNLHPTESLSLYSGAGTGPKDSSHTPPTRGHAYSLSLGAPTGDSLAMVPSSGPSYLYSQSSVPSTLPISSSSRRLSDAPDVIPPRHISARGLRQSQANPSAPPTTGSLSLSTSHSSVLPSKPPQLPNTIYSSTSLNYTPTNPYLLSRPDQPQSGSLEPEPFDRALPPIPASGPPFDADGFHRSSAQPLIYERDRDRGDRPSPRRGRNPNLPAPLFLAASPDPNAGLQPPRTRDRRVTSESEPDRTPSRNNRFSLPFLSSPTPPESPTTASASRSGSSPSPRTPQATGATSTTSPPSPKLLSANSVGALSSTSSPKSSAATLAASSPAVPPPPSSSLTVPGAKFQSPPSPTTAEAEESSKSRSRPLSWLGVSRRSTSRERSPQPSFRRSFGDLDSAISALTKPWTFGLSSKPAAADITPPDADRGRQRARTTSAKMTVISQSKPDRAVGKSKADAPLFVQQSPSTLTRQPDFASPVPPPRNRRTTAQDRSTSRNRDGRERTAEFSYLSPTSSVSPTSPISLHKALPATPIADLTFATAKPSFSGPKPAVDLHRSNTNKEVTQKPRTRTQPHEEEVTQPVWTPTVPSRKERDAPRTEEKAGLAEYEREKPAAVSQDHEPTPSPNTAAPVTRSTAVEHSVPQKAAKNALDSRARRSLDEWSEDDVGEVKPLGVPESNLRLGSSTVEAFGALTKESDDQKPVPTIQNRGVSLPLLVNSEVRVSLPIAEVKAAPEVTMKEIDVESVMEKEDEFPAPLSPIEEWSEPSLSPDGNQKIEPSTSLHRGYSSHESAVFQGRKGGQEEDTERAPSTESAAPAPAAESEATMVPDAVADLIPFGLEDPLSPVGRADQSESEPIIVSSATDEQPVLATLPEQFSPVLSNADTSHPVDFAMPERFSPGLPEVVPESKSSLPYPDLDSPIPSEDPLLPSINTRDLQEISPMEESSTTVPKDHSPVPPETVPLSHGNSVFTSEASVIFAPGPSSDEGAGAISTSDYNVPSAVELASVNGIFETTPNSPVLVDMDEIPANVVIDDGPTPIRSSPADMPSDPDISMTNPISETVTSLPDGNFADPHADVNAIELPDRKMTFSRPDPIVQLPSPITPPPPLTDDARVHDTESAAIESTLLSEISTIRDIQRVDVESSDDPMKELDPTSSTRWNFASPSFETSPTIVDMINSDQTAGETAPDMFKVDELVGATSLVFLPEHNGEPDARTEETHVFVPAALVERKEVFSAGVAPASQVSEESSVNNRSDIQDENRNDITALATSQAIIIPDDHFEQETAPPLADVSEVPPVVAQVETPPSIPPLKDSSVANKRPIPENLESTAGSEPNVADSHHATPSPPARAPRKTPATPSDAGQIESYDEPRHGSKKRSTIPEGPPRSATLPELSRPPRRATSGSTSEVSSRPPSDGKEKERGQGRVETRERSDAPSRPPSSSEKSHSRSHGRRPSRPGPDGVEGTSSSAHDKKERERERSDRSERSERSKSARSEDREKRGASSSTVAAEAGGKYLGHFRILRSIGEGEFGKVKLGVDARTGQEVAVKLVRKEGLLGAKREKLMREIALLKTAHHPHIVKLFDIIETERHVGLVMEYAAGGELFEHILQRKMLKESEAKALFRELCGGVSYLHAHGIVHRDLKLENLLLTHDRHLLITDFGFATTVRRSSPTEEAPPTPSPGYERRLLHTSCGSPCYAAPELVLGEGGYDGEKADAWSCGVILFAMCCGYLPFDDDPTSPSSLDISRLYRHIVTSTISFPDHVTAGAREVIRGLLDTEPEDRWSVAKAAQHWWVRGEKPKRDRIGAASSTDGPERGGLVAGMINRLEHGKNDGTPSSSRDKAPTSSRPINIPLHPPQLAPITIHDPVTALPTDPPKLEGAQKQTRRAGDPPSSLVGTTGTTSSTAGTGEPIMRTTGTAPDSITQEGHSNRGDASGGLPRAHSNVAAQGLTPQEATGSLRRIRSTLGFDDNQNHPENATRTQPASHSPTTPPSLSRPELPPIQVAASRASGGQTTSQMSLTSASTPVREASESTGMDTLELPPFRGGLKVRDTSHQSIASMDSAIDYASAPSNSSLKMFNQSELDARRPSATSVELSTLNRRESRDPSGDDTDSAISALSQQRATPKRLQVLFNEANEELPRDKQSGPLFSAARPKRMSIMGAIKNISSFTTMAVPKVEYRVFNARQDKPLDNDAVFRTDPDKLLNWIAAVTRQPQKGWYETQKIKSLKSEGAGWRVIVWVREGKLPTQPPTPSGSTKFGVTPSKSTFGINLSGAKSVMTMGSKLNAGSSSKNPFTRFKSRLMSFTEPERETPIEEEPEPTGPGWVAPPKKEEIRFEAEVLNMGQGRYGVEFRRSHGEVWYFLRLRREILAAVAKLVLDYNGRRIDPMPPPPPDRMSKSSAGSFEIESNISNKSDSLGAPPPPPAPVTAASSIPQSVSTPAVSSLSAGPSSASWARSRAQSGEPSNSIPPQSLDESSGASSKVSIRNSIAASIPRLMGNRAPRGTSGYSSAPPGLNPSTPPRPAQTGSLSLASRLAKFEGNTQSGEQVDGVPRSSTFGSVRLTGQYGGRLS